MAIAFAADAAKGKQGFMKYGCWQCHGTVGQGSPITGPVLIRIVDPPAGAVTVSLVTGLGNTTRNYAPATLRSADAALVRRRADDAPGETVPPEKWAFADCRQTPFPCPTGQSGTATASRSRPA